jgi:cytochrome oxidase Cu insertion factor (SCO1/SenC/PrrC family)
MKILRILYGAVLLCGLLTMAGGCAAPCPDDVPDLGAVPDFKLDSSQGGTLSRGDLEGKVWVAAFVFTRCGGPCPQVSSSMQQLQTEMKSADDFRLVTFTVDPSFDTAEVLRRYAETWQADPRRWYFLTGKQAEVHELIHDGFKLGVQENKGSDRTGGNEFIHSSKLVLVDRGGHIRGYYDGRKIDETGAAVTELERLKANAGLVLRE